MSSVVEMLDNAQESTGLRREEGTFVHLQASVSPVLEHAMMMHSSRQRRRPTETRP
jgi:hypothetical protein